MTFLLEGDDRVWSFIYQLLLGPKYQRNSLEKLLVLIKFDPLFTDINCHEAQSLWLFLREVVNHPLNYCNEMLKKSITMIILKRRLLS